MRTLFNRFASRKARLSVVITRIWEITQLVLIVVVPAIIVWQVAIFRP